MLGESIHACNYQNGRMIIAKLAPKTDLLHGIENICREYMFQSAVITACFGSLGEACFENIAEDKGNILGTSLGEPIFLEGPLQVLSAQGTVSFDEEQGKAVAHLHAVLCDKNSIVYGGHLLAGKNTVMRTMEIAIQEVTGINLFRRYNPKTDSIQLMIEKIS